MIEILESRIAPAALIDIIAKNGSAMLKVHGNADSADSLVITGFGDGRLMIEGLNGETFTKNGVPGTGPITLEGLTQDLSVDLGKGDDTLVMGGLLLGGKLTIKMGEGENTTTITNAEVGGSMSYTGGKGSDTLTTDGAVFAVSGAIAFAGEGGVNKFQIHSTELSAGGNLTYTGGNEADTLEVKSTQANIAGALSFLASAGANNLTYVGDSFQVGKSLLFLSGKNRSPDPGGLSIASTKTTHIGGALTYINPMGDQTFGISGDVTEIGGATFLKASPGNDSMASITGTSVSTAKITLASTGDHLSFDLDGDTLAVGGALMIRGAKNLRILGVGTIAGAATLTSTSGLSIGGGANGQLVIGGALSYKGNSALTNTSSALGLTVAGPANFDLRKGVDMLTIETTRFLKALTINSGEASDTVSIETGGLAGESLFAGAVAINLGGSADHLTVGSMSSNDKLTALKKFIVTGGGGGGDVVSLLNGTNVFVVGPVVK